MASPAPMDSRFISLDVVRGIAVMGILLMNIVGFAMPFQAYSNPTAYGGTGPIDMAFWATNFVLADGKMRGLFSILFGASMLLVIQRAEASQRSSALTHYSRMTWLLLFGVIHAYAIWYGDILMLYAGVGMVAYFFRKMEAHKLVTLGIILIIAQAVLVGGVTYSLWALREAALAPDAQPETVQAWFEMAAMSGSPPPDALAANLALYRGDYAGIMEQRLGPDLMLPIIGNFMFSFATLGLMLLGMAGLKSGFLTGALSRETYAKCIRYGYLVGIPIQMLLALFLMRSGFDPVSLWLYDMSLQMVPDLLIILAHAALILYWVKSSAGSALIARVAATGRAAFTNYLGTSLVCTTIFYGYGFGFYGEFSRASLYIVVLGVWALMLLWSKPWLDRFRYGPLEWLWRSLSRRELQPIRKQ
jgi:uncharacterized protein